MRTTHLALANHDTGPMPVSDIEYQRAARFFKRLRSQPFIAILVDADHDEVRMYVKGVDVNNNTLRRMRELIDEVESNMKEPNG